MSGSGSWIPRIGQEFAGYRLDGLIGSGGMSIVYKAEHLDLGRTVALKLMNPQLSEDDDFRDRFLRESRTAASLDHPNIIPIFEAGEADGVFYIAMRYVDGSDLKRVLKEEGTLSVDRTVAIISQVAAALSVAHAKGLVHRDIKPANILLAPGIGVDETDHVYLSDFGVAKLNSSPALTRTGVFVGTIDYAAPEQIEGKEVDGRADIYALGCVLYQCLTGAPAYQRDSEAALMYAHLLEPPPSVFERRPDIQPEIDPVLARAMAKSVDERFATTREFALALRQAAAAIPDVQAGGTGATDETRLAPPIVVGEAVSGALIAAPPATADPASSPSPSAAPPAPPAAPFGDSDPPAAPPSETSAGRTPSSSGVQISHRALVLGGAVLVAAIVAVVLGVVAFGGGSSPSAVAPTVPSGASLPSNTVAVTHGILPLIPGTLRDGCTEAATAPGAVKTVACLPPANRKLPFYPDRWSVSGFASAAALKKAYEDERAAHNVTADGGRCDGTTWGGEGPWNHGPGKPGGRRFCYFDGNVAVVVWTHAKLGQPTHIELLGTARAGGSNHDGLFNWWRFWHHRIGKCPDEGCVAKLT